MIAEKNGVNIEGLPEFHVAMDEIYSQIIEWLEELEKSMKYPQIL